MNREDAQRRLRALRNLTEDKGAYPAEVDNARNLIRMIEDRYQVEDLPPEKDPRLVPDWPYWNWILSEFGLQGRRFLKSASANLDADRIIVIRLDTGDWQVQRKNRSGYETIVQNYNPESLRAFSSTTPKLTFSLIRGQRKGLNAHPGRDKETVMAFLNRMFMKAREWHKGQTMTEYALILAAVAVVVFVTYEFSVRTSIHWSTDRQDLTSS